MLSRVADSLFWLSRYIERAENLARLVEVNRHDALEMRGEPEGERHWRRVIYATCTEETWKEAREGDERDEDVGRFITFSEANTDSLRRCIANARENARMVRDQISEEMWLELNSIHLYFQSADVEARWNREPEAIYRKIIQFSLLFQGLTDATILHSEGWHFVRLGKFIERADKTSRILDILTYSKDPERGDLASVLRSCSGFSAFREEFRGDVSLENVVSFLLFSQTFPRSVRFCLWNLDQTIHSISGSPPGSFSNEPERLAGSMLARINFTSTEEVFEHGVHEYIDEIQAQLNEIGQKVFETYVLNPQETQSLPMANASSGFRWQFQQQG